MPRSYTRHIGSAADPDIWDPPFFQTLVKQIARTIFGIFKSPDLLTTQVGVVSTKWNFRIIWIADVGRKSNVLPDLRAIGKSVIWTIRRGHC